MQAYSMDLRVRVARARDDGMTTRETAETFGCSESWVRRLMQNQRERGTLEPVERAVPDRRKFQDADQTKLREFIAGRPDATLAEIAAWFGHKASESSVSRTLKRMGLPRKKSRSTPASRTGLT
jgi:transposase